MKDILRRWAAAAKREARFLRLAATDPRVPWYAKALCVAVAAYVLSPIDLIPDFIPIIGWLDDLVLAPLGIWLAIRLIPRDLRDELRRKARGDEG